MKYQGSWDGGQVTFEVEGELAQVTEGNCSICSRNGSLLWAVSADNFRLLSAEEELATYTFGKQSIKHRFCPRCGIHTFAEGILSEKPMVVINVRCLEGIDLSALPVKHFDGRSR